MVRTRMHLEVPHDFLALPEDALVVPLVPPPLKLPVLHLQNFPCGLAVPRGSFVVVTVGINRLSAADHAG